MKTLLLFLLLPTLTIAQTWAPTGATWTYSQATINPNYTTYTTFESIADTVVGGQSCRAIRKIERSGPVAIDTSSFFMYSASNRVYSHIGTTWCLLYDFNAHAGDTFKLDCFLNSTGQAIVVTVLSVDTIAINGHPRKRFTYSATDILVEFSGTVIEGIGHTIDMFPTYDNYMRGPLRCYEDYELGLYKNEYYYGSTWSLPCDQIIVGIDEQLDNEKALVFPNPFTDNITFTSSINEPTTVFLYDILGHQVLWQTFSNSMTLNTGQFAEGVYFYELRTNKQTISKGKIIKD